MSYFADIKLGRDAHGVEWSLYAAARGTGYIPELQTRSGKLRADLEAMAQYLGADVCAEWAVVIDTHLRAQPIFGGSAADVHKAEIRAVAVRALEILRQHAAPLVGAKGETDAEDDY